MENNPRLPELTSYSYYEISLPNPLSKMFCSFNSRFFVVVVVVVVVVVDAVVVGGDSYCLHGQEKLLIKS